MGLFDNFMQQMWSDAMSPQAMTQAGMASQAAPQATGGDDFWGKFAALMKGDEQNAGAASGLMGMMDANDQVGRTPWQIYPHQSPQGQPIQNPGFYGLSHLIGMAGR